MSNPGSDLSRARTGTVDRGGTNPQTGRPRCRGCGHDIPSGSRRTSFCSDDCVHDWQLATNPGYVRKLVYKRDAGKCASCGVDTDAVNSAFVRWVIALAAPTAPKAGEHHWAAYNRIIDHPEYSSHIREWLAFHGIPRNRRESRWWDADHIVPVAEGGGTCGLSNYQTLCLDCHRIKTAEQAARRRQAPPRSPAIPDAQGPPPPQSLRDRPTPPDRARENLAPARRRIA